MSTATASPFAPGVRALYTLGGRLLDAVAPHMPELIAPVGELIDGYAALVATHPHCAQAAQRALVDGTRRLVAGDGAVPAPPAPLPHRH